MDDNTPKRKRKKTTRSKQQTHVDSGQSGHAEVSRHVENFSQTDNDQYQNIEYRGHIYSRHNYLGDKKRKIDFVLVSSVLKQSEELDLLVTYIINLVKQGVEYEICQGQGYPELVFVKLHCPMNVLQHYAQIYNILFDCQNPRDMPKLENAGFRWKMLNNVTTMRDPFHPDYPRALSSLSQVKQKGITSWERSLVLEKILTNTEFGPEEKERGYRKLRSRGVLIDAYPIHDGPCDWKDTGPLTDRQLLTKYWASLRCLYKNQPIRLIYKYYGPEVAFYFAFFDFYNKMLVVPTVIGMFCFIYTSLYFRLRDKSRITEICSSTITLCPNCYYEDKCDFSYVYDHCYAVEYDCLFDNAVGIGFAIFSTMWATIFVGLWQRREFLFKFHWNLLNCQINMTQRIEFELKAKHTKMSPVSGERIRYMPCYQKFFKYLLTSFCFILMMGLIVLCQFIVTYTRIYLHLLITQSQSDSLRKYSDLIVLSVSALQSIFFINILTPHFLRVTLILTKEENPWSMLDFYNSCTYKFYFLAFFNNYVPILYIGLLRGQFFTYPGDLSNYTFLGLKTDLCSPVGCTIALTSILAFLLSSKMFIVRPVQCVISRLMNLYRRKRALKDLHPKLKNLPAWERDYKLKGCDVVFLMTNFMDIAIQYGFVIFFIAALPLAPLLALVTNIISVRLDATSLLKTYRRPVAKLVPGIRSWNSILRFVTFIGAMTNAFIIAFTSDLIDMEVYRSSQGSIKGFINSTFSVFAVKDYSPEFNNILKKHPTIQTCSYKGRRSPPWEPGKYEFSEEHWKVLYYKLGFVLIFQQILWLVTAICSTAVSPIPDEVLEELNDEMLKIREDRFESTVQSLYGRKPDAPRNRFVIE